MALQPCATDCPAAGKSKVNVQALTGEPRLVMDTLAVNPFCHWLCTAYVTEHPLAAADAGSTTPAIAATTNAPTEPEASRAYRRFI